MDLPSQMNKCIRNRTNKFPNMSASPDFIALLSDLRGKSILNLLETIYRAYREYMNFGLFFSVSAIVFHNQIVSIINFFFSILQRKLRFIISHPFKLRTYARYSFANDQTIESF